MLKHALTISAAILSLSPTVIAQSEDTEYDRTSDEFIPLMSMSLPTVIVTSLRDSTPDDVTSDFALLRETDLAIRNTPNAADQLRAVPGVAVSRSGSQGGLTQVRLRGGEANHTLVLLNGIEVSDPITGETDFGLLNGVPVTQIEVARGEQSSIFGSDAIGGVINIQAGTQKGATALLEVGNRSTYRLEGAYGFDLGSGKITIALNDYITDGVDTSGRGGEKDGSQAYGGVVTTQHSINRTWQLNGLARYGYSEVDTDPDTDFDGRLDNADRVTEAEQVTLGLSLQGDTEWLNHLLRLSYNSVERENFGDGLSLNTSEGERTKFSYSPSISFDAGIGEATMSGLIDYEQEDYTARDSQFGGFTNQDQSFESLGLALEGRWKTESLTLNASVRQDDNDGRFEDARTWRLGGAYTFFNGPRVRASIGTGVKNPTFTELFGFFPGSFIGNPDLNPEQSQSWEVGFDQDVYDWTLSVTYFEAELEDEIFTQFNPDFTSTAANRVGESERKGIEAAAMWTVSDTLYLNASATNLSSQNDSGIAEIRVPEWTGSVSLAWTPDEYSFGLAADYVGEQLDTDFGTFQTVTLDPYWLVSASGEFPVSERLAITLRGENLLDEMVTDVFGFNGPGASVLIGLKLRN